MRRPVRVFLAVALPADVAAAMSPAARALPRAGWRQTAPEHRHITLRFLGEQAEAAVRAALTAAERAAAARPAFALELAGLGAFPGAARPQVVWAGCRAGAEALAELAGGLEDALADAGLPAADGPFRAHVTLARRRREHPPAAAAADLAAVLTAHGAGVWGTAPVDALLLFRSELGPGGPRYSLLGRAPLAPRARPEIP